MSKQNRTKRLAPAVLALTALDQGIKLWIAGRCPGASVTLISRRLRFQPVVNQNLSWAGHFVPWLRKKKVAVGLNLAALALIWRRWRQICRRSRSAPSSLARAGAALSLSAGLCSLLDKTLWGGSLDYIQIPEKCTFDLKDLYLAGGLACLAPLCLRPEGGETADEP